jgi:hypothetical protein
MKLSSKPAIDASRWNAAGRAQLLRPLLHDHAWLTIAYAQCGDRQHLLE